MSRRGGKAGKLPGSKVLKRFPLGERQASPKKCDWGSLWILRGAGKSLLLLLLSPCPAQGYWFASVACSSYSFLLSHFSAWLSGATLSPSPSALCLPSSLLHCSRHSPCIHPNQKQLLRGRSIQNPEHTYGEGVVEKQSEDCWLGVYFSTLQRKKWHFSTFQNSMTTFECPNPICAYATGVILCHRKYLCRGHVVLVPVWLPGKKLGNLGEQMSTLKKLQVSCPHFLCPFLAVVQPVRLA